ncbi:MAG: hypothetical protein RL410_1571 [Actinomycetota bacterium]|jgi:UPF0042 nucleotide-binding protein
MGKAPELVLLTGLSGAGRSTAARALEDIGFMVIDNLPPQLLSSTIETVSAQGGVPRIAVVADARGGRFFDSLASSLDEVKPLVSNLTVVFLEANDALLVRRFESTRRPHPLHSAATLLEAVQQERALLQPLRDQADLIIDTTERNVHDLRREIESAFDTQETRLRVTVTSFGFKYGIPVDADYVADVRFLPNPFWIEELRHLTGLDAPVNDYVVEQPDAKFFLTQFSGLLQGVTEGYLREGKRYVTVAIGCTGGQHRSVAIAENLAARLVKHGVEVHTVHRDRGRE